MWYCRVYVCVHLHTAVPVMLVFSGFKKVKIRLACVWNSMHWHLPVFKVIERR